MFSAILILLAMPFTDLSRFRGIQFRPLSKAAFFVFIGNFLILMQLGAKHVESPFIEFGQISTVIYFAHFLVIVPFISLLENSLIELAVEESEIVYSQPSSAPRPEDYIKYNHSSLAGLNVIFLIIISFFISNSSGSYEYCDAPRP
jgi:ubiquinol-cytochrome c reductase cytochrome b subunit